MKLVLLWNEHEIILQSSITAWSSRKWLDSRMFFFSFFSSSLGMTGSSNTKESYCFLICWYTKKDGSLFWVKKKGKSQVSAMFLCIFFYFLYILVYFLYIIYLCISCIFVYFLSRPEIIRYVLNLHFSVSLHHHLLY